MSNVVIAVMSDLQFNAHRTCIAGGEWEMQQVRKVQHLIHVFSSANNFVSLFDLWVTSNPINRTY